MASLTEAQRREVAEEFSEEIENALVMRATLEDDWQRWLALYQGTHRTHKKNTPWQGASNLVINLSAIYADSITAKIMQSVFGVKPHWTVNPLGQDLQKEAKALERYLDWARQHMWSQYRAVKPMILETIKLGTGILTVGWDQTEIRRRVLGADGKTSTARDVTENPRVAWVPREDFLLTEGFTRINRSEDGAAAPWVAYRQWFSRQDLERMSSSGFIEIDDELFSTPDEETRLREQRRTGENPANESGLWSPWQVWFARDLDNDGFPEEYVMMLHVNTHSVLRFRPNPLRGGLRPFVATPFIEQEGAFDGVGVPQMVEDYQEEVTTIHNQRRDNAHIANTTMLVTRQGSGITRKEKIFPGKIFFVTDPNTDLKELRLGQNYMATIPEEQVSVSMAERRVGISDINMGRESSPLGRAAATTVMALLQEGTRRFDLNTAELRLALTEVGLIVVELFQEFGLPEPESFRSPEIVLGPKDGALVRSIIETQDDIRGVIGVTLNASTAAINRETEKQASLQLFGFVMQYLQQVFQIGQLIADPQAPPQLKALALSMTTGADALLEKVFSSHEAYDLDSLMASELLGQLAAAPQAPPPQALLPQGPQQAPAGNGAIPQGSPNDFT